MRVVFRADASATIGGGHVMRCMTLAAELRQRGHECLLLAAPTTAEVFPDLSGSTDLRLLDAETVSLQSQADLNALHADLFVIDHYDLPLAVETAARRAAPVVAFDDIPGRRHDCDLLVDPTFGRRPADYAACLPAGAKALCGAAYALIRPAFARLRRETVRRGAEQRIRRLSICFGATDVRHLSGSVAARLAARFPDMAIDVILGRAAAAALGSDMADALPDTVKLHIDPPDLPSLLGRSDLAIGSAGTMSWERCCLGLASIAVPLVDNQRDIAAALVQTGSAAIVPVTVEDVPGAICEAVAELDGDRKRREWMSACAAAICDGLGAPRVASRIEALARGEGEVTAGLALRPASDADSEVLWAWRNDYDSRRVSRETDPVAWRHHDRWYAASLANPDRMIVMVDWPAHGESVGMVRFDRNADGEAVVSINMAAQARGQGVAQTILEAACKRAFAAWPVERLVAMVRMDNRSSQNLFRNAGFQLQSEADDFSRFVLARSNPDV